MRVEVLYFAGAREATGRPSESVLVDAGDTVAGLRRALGLRHPALCSVLAGSRFAVGERFAPDTQVLVDGDVVALLPPVSGG